MFSEHTLDHVIDFVYSPRLLTEEGDIISLDMTCVLLSQFCFFCFLFVAGINDSWWAGLAGAMPRACVVVHS